MSNRKDILTVESLNKVFKTKNSFVKPVDNVSFSLKEGEVLGLIGESGSGKTTIGRTLIRLIPDFSGVVKLDGKNVSGDKITKSTRKFLRKNMQMIFQDPHASLNSHKNVFSILAEPIRVNGILAEDYRKFKKYNSTVIENNRLAFREMKHESELEYHRFLLSGYVDTYEKIEKLLDDFDIDKFRDVRNALEDLNFRFYNTKFEQNKLILKKLVKITKSQSSFYDSRLKRLKTGKIDKEEIELLELKETLEYEEKYGAYEPKFKKVSDKLESQEMRFDSIRKDNVEKIKATRELLTSTVSGVKLISLEAKQRRDTAQTYEEYNKENVRYLVTKTFSKELKKNASGFEMMPEDDFVEFKASYKQIIEAVTTYYGSVLKNTTSKSKITKELKIFITQQTYEVIFHYRNKSARVTSEFMIDLEKNRQYVDDLLGKTEEIKLEKIDNSIEIDGIRAKLEVKRTEYEAEIKEGNMKLDAELAKLDEKIQADKNALKEFRNTKAKEINDKYKTQLKEIYSRCKKDVEIYSTMAKIAIKLKEVDYDISAPVNDDAIFINGSDDEKLLEQLSEFNKLKGEHEFIYKIIKSQYPTLNKKRMTVKRKELAARLGNFKSAVLNFERKNKAFDVEINENRKNERVIWMMMGLQKSWFQTPKIKSALASFRIFETLEEVGLSAEHAFRYPHEFSGGQRQRIAIGRALISRPKVIIADEPIASLDISIQAQIVNLLRKLATKNGIAIIFIAHDLSMVNYIADRTLIIHLGKLVEKGETSEIFSHPVHPYTKNLFDAIPKISNANIKFKMGDYEPQYLKEYNDIVIPGYWKVGEQHQVLASEKQIKKWFGNNAEQVN